MSDDIIELSPEIYNKIAAGEVIERPASVVKELVENSIDAGSTSIKIFINDAGKKEITIIDNGKGIKGDYLKLAVRKHTTSKIKKLEDIFRIETLGFRGEALSSIASVSRISIETRHINSEDGCRLIVETGKTGDFGKIGIPVGTKIKVENLFFNTPARLKFLRSNTTEEKYIKNIVTNLMLGYPGIEFEFFSNGRKLFKMPICSNLFKRIEAIFGNEISSKLIKIEDRGELFNFEGFISDYTYTRPTKSLQKLFLNKRPITANFFYASIYRAYEGLLMKGRNPVALIFIQSRPEFYDVNVHPTKKEVRFSNENLVFETLVNTIRKGLKDKGSYPSIMDEFKIKREIKFNHKEGTARALELYLKKRQPEPEKGFKQKFQKPEKKEEITTTTFFSKIYGQIFENYILLEHNNDFLIVDQHAAHERIIYERLKKDFKNRKPLSQRLLMPFNLELLPEEFETYKEQKELLKNIGYEIEEFGENSIVVSSIPSYVRRSDDKQLLMDIIDLLCNKEFKQDRMKISDEMLKLIACKSAVRAGEKQTEKEMEILIEQLLQLDEHITCPHGRPTIIKMSRSDLEKAFLRK